MNARACCERIHRRLVKQIEVAKALKNKDLEGDVARYKLMTGFTYCKSMIVFAYLLTGGILVLRPNAWLGSGTLHSIAKSAAACPWNTPCG